MVFQLQVQRYTFDVPLMFVFLCDIADFSNNKEKPSIADLDHDGDSLADELTVFRFTDILTEKTSRSFGASGLHEPAHYASDKNPHYLDGPVDPLLAEVVRQCRATQLDQHAFYS